MSKRAPVLFLYLIFTCRVKTSQDDYMPKAVFRRTLQNQEAVSWQLYLFHTKALKGHWDFFFLKSHEKFVISNCAIRSNGLVIRSLKLDNSFSRIAICSLELDNPFSRVTIRSLELDNPFSRVASRSLELRVVREFKIMSITCRFHVSVVVLTLGVSY